MQVVVCTEFDVLQQLLSMLHIYTYQMHDGQYIMAQIFQSLCSQLGHKPSAPVQQPISRMPRICMHQYNSPLQLDSFGSVPTCIKLHKHYLFTFRIGNN